MPKRIVFTGKNTVEIENFQPTPLKPNEIKVKMLCSLISSGTEGIVLHRRFDPGTHYDAWVQYPFYPGYSSVGEIIEIGGGVARFKVGDRVVHRNGHSEIDILPEDDRFLVVVPPGLDPAQASWFALAKIASMAIPVCGNLFGATVVMLGAGPVGQMLARWLNAAGVARLIVVEPVPLRLKLLKNNVAAEVLECRSAEAVSRIAELTGGKGADLVVDTTGNAAVFGDALKIARKFGRIVMLGDTGTPAGQHLSPDVINKGLTIVGAHDSHETPDWNSKKILPQWFAYIAEGKIRFNGLNTHTLKPEAAVEAYRLATECPADALGVLFDWH